MRKIINTKTNDFKELIESKNLYVDKTLFIKELIDNPSQAICFLRPRRFGKSLNLSMLNYYFNLEYKDKTLFNGLKIMNQGEKYLKEMNKYPVVSISFRDLKADTYQDFLKSYKELMANLFSKYEYLLESDKLDEIEKEDFRKIIRKEEDRFLEDALSNLLAYLNKYYGERVIVLLDDYDVPIFHAYEKGYYDEMKKFIGCLFEITFKGNNNLKRGIITGIIGMIFGDIFGGANNIVYYDLTYSRYSTYFGFTESEVKDVLREYNLLDNFDDVKEWYDGYLFNKYTIYNPWSILSFLGNYDHALIPYWGNTGGVHLIKNLIYNLNNRQEILNSYENLLKTDYIEHINLNIKLDLTDLEGDRDNIYTLLMLSGYLTPAEFKPDLKDVKLRIPNLEVKEELESIVKNWFKDPLKGYDFTEYLYNNKLELFKTTFENVVIESFSYYDVPDNNNGENFYHAFTMGLLRSGCNNYEITSNREAGYGRYDLILKPYNKNVTTYIIEFKVAGSDFDKAIEDGFRQIDEMKYEVSLKGYKIVKMVIAFKGKRLKIETR